MIMVDIYMPTIDESFDFMIDVELLPGKKQSENAG